MNRLLVKARRGGRLSRHKDRIAAVPGKRVSRLARRSLLKGAAASILVSAAGGMLPSPFFARRSLAAATPLTIRHGATVMNVLSPLIFSEPKILEHYGTSYVVEPVHFGGTSPQVTAFAAGEIDIAELAFSTLSIAIENARLQDLRVVADGLQDGVDGYVSTPFFVRKESEIKTVADLKGKVVAVNVIGAGVDIAQRTMLERHGLRPGKDYAVVEAEFPAMPAMLVGKKADLVAVPPPFAYDPRLVEGARVLFTAKDAMGIAQTIIFTARTGFLERHRPALDDFFEDWVRGIHWIQDPANRTAAIAMAARFSKLPPERLASYFGTKKDYYRDPNGLPNIDALQRNIDTQFQLGFIKSKLEVRQYLDLSFIKRGADRLKSKT